MVADERSQEEKLKGFSPIAQLMESAFLMSLIDTQKERYVIVSAFIKMKIPENKEIIVKRGEKSLAKLLCKLSSDYIMDDIGS